MSRIILKKETRFCLSVEAAELRRLWHHRLSVSGHWSTTKRWLWLSAAASSLHTLSGMSSIWEQIVVRVYRHVIGCDYLKTAVRDSFIATNFSHDPLF